jgi:flotillin
MPDFVMIIIVSVFVFFTVAMTFAMRFKKCPSDQIMVVFGRVGGSRSIKCIHGGATFVWPLFQDYRYLSLRPMQIEINLNGALSRQNIRINTPSTYTVGISTEPQIMRNAAERLLSMTHRDIAVAAQEIIFGQQRLVIASMDIEEINANRDAFLLHIKNNVESELNKIGLRLINVNITDITDEEGYLEALGKKAAAEVTNRALVEVAEQVRVGETGKAKADQQRRIAVAQAETEAAKGEAMALQQKRVALAEAETMAAQGEALAQQEKRVALAAAEAEAKKGEAFAEQHKRVALASADAEAVKGEASAQKDQRITVKNLDSEAVQGENLAAIEVAKSDAERREVQEESRRRAEAAKMQADARIKSSAFEAEEQMQVRRAAMMKEKEIAEKVVPAQVAKQEKEIQAEAEAEMARRKARGEADATFADLEAQARGRFELLKAKADYFRQVIDACGNDAGAAATMLMVEKVEDLVQAQVEAIKNIKIDKVVVWDNLGNGSGNGNGTGKSNTASFLSNIVSALPPLQDIAKTAGIDLPGFLGRVKPESTNSNGRHATPLPRVPAEPEGAAAEKDAENSGSQQPEFQARAN